MYEMLGSIIGSTNFTPDNWTSKIRNDFLEDHAMPEDQLEADYADFTFKDGTGAFASFLYTHGHGPARAWIKAIITYHVEVKSTVGKLTDVFHLSWNQMNMARRKSLLDKPADHVPDEVYVLLRVYSLDNEDDCEVTALVDPWAMYQKGELTVGPKEYLLQVKDKTSEH